MNLNVENVSYRLGKKVLLDNISLSLQERERVAIIGPNGSGKSTLLRLICGLNKPTQGEVLLANRCVHRYPRRQLAQSLAFVQQKANTEDIVRAEEAVSLGRTPWIKPFEAWSEHHQRFVEKALLQVDMQDKRHQYWHTLSGGEQQRLHIARALAQNTPFIVMDEPTNHLDIKQQLGVLSLIYHIERTMLVAVHDLNHAMRFDRVIVLKNGRLVAQGAPETLITEALIKEVFEVESKVIKTIGLPSSVQLIA